MTMDYEYHGLMAETWDLLRGDATKWPDRAFFRWVIRRSGQPVLDAGCGTGRLLLDYRGRGIDIEGVDVSPDMLAICRRKARERRTPVTLHLQPMEALDTGRRYRTIIVPSSSFQLITDARAAREAVQRFHRHLVPGGMIAMSIMDLDKEPHTEEWALDAEAACPDGTVVRRWTRASYDSKLQLEHTESRYDVLQDGRVTHSENHRRSPGTRSYSLSEATSLLAEEGFGEIRCLANFTLRPATPADRLFCLLGRSRA